MLLLLDRAQRWVRQLQQYEHGKADLLTSQQVEIGRRLARVRQQEKMDQMALLEKQRQRHAAQRTWRNKHLASGAMPQSSTYTTASDFV